MTRIGQLPLVDQVEFWSAKVIEAATDREAAAAGRQLALAAHALAVRVRQMAVEGVR